MKVSPATSRGPRGPTPDLNTQTSETSSQIPNSVSSNSSSTGETRHIFFLFFCTGAFDFQMCWILKLMYVFIHLRAASMCVCIYTLSAALAGRPPPRARLCFFFFFFVELRQHKKTDTCLIVSSRRSYLFYVNTFGVHANFLFVPQHPCV